ncbi:hypothetical protein F5876DRAFT_53539 [Lentinula aff. lateritia]|uniref:Uncharacterized protein n=1 Tax=Lentinula aff. lateritia TaxID=2804960 RepID=A0ACC1THZ8_9AGAR|nr:hypothetical protein F5876DRAFT_53539 [Lentinula aff. lateritia]
MTRLKFGDFTSAPILLTNGIGKGDPLSMIAYLFYNADFFDIMFKLRRQGLSVGFIDDKNILVEGKSLTENVEIRALPQHSGS